MHRFTRAQCRGRHSQDFVIRTVESLLELQTRYKGSGMHYITRFKTHTYVTREGMNGVLPPIPCGTCVRTSDMHGLAF